MAAMRLRVSREHEGFNRRIGSGRSPIDSWSPEQVALGRRAQLAPLAELKEAPDLVVKLEAARERFTA
jgi:hypothetical protein